MNIPFYRYVDYAEDGHYIYQCLQCGEKIDVGYVYYDFNPRFCFRCGVEYQGMILPRKEDWVYANSESRGKLLFKIEFSNIWSDDKENARWTTHSGGYCRNDVIDEIKKLRYWEEEKKKNSLKRYGRGYDVVYRIAKYRENPYQECFDIDPDKYFKRTGKKFNRKDYENVA